MSQDVCGIQAQVMSAAQMALWARMHHLTRADIHSALWKDRALVKTSCMRGTLHLLPATDFSVYIRALKRSRMEALQRIMSKFGISPRDADGMTQAVVAALSDGPRTQGELTAQIKPLVGKRLRRWMDLVWNVFKPALVEGHICYGPERGQEVTFVRVDQWLPKQKEADEQQAKQFLLRRYLRAYGPASPRDFSKWAGLPIREVTPVWESLDEEFVEVCVEGWKGSILREDCKNLSGAELAGPMLRLLPGFDPYLLGHAEKNHLVSERHYKRVYRNQGWISPVVLLNGRVIGIWSYQRRGKKLSFEVELFHGLSKTLRARIEREAASLGDFFETSWEMKFRL